MKCEKYSLFELADWKNGVAFKKKDFSAAGKPIIKIAELKNGITEQTKFTQGNYGEAVFLTKGDMVFSWSGNPETSIDVFWYDLPDGWLNQHIFKVKPNQFVDKNYFYYLLKSLKPRFTAIASNKQTTGLGHITVKDLKELIINLPALSTQEKIGNYLGIIDRKVYLNNKINENLQQQAQAIFESWFIDYEPWGGIMPDNWNEVSLDTVIDFQNGYAFKSKDLLKESFPDTYRVFKQGHINRGGGFNSEGTKSWYLKESARHLEKYVLHKGDVLMAMTDMKNNVAILGNTAIMPIDNEYILNQRVGLLRPKGVYGITYPFIYFLTNSQEFLSDLRSRANSGVQVNLSSTAIKSTKFVLAPKEVNEQFSSITIPMMEMIFRNQNENEKLSHLRDALLPKLMSGEIDVEDVEL